MTDSSPYLAKGSDASTQKGQPLKQQASPSPIPIFVNDLDGLAGPAHDGSVGLASPHQAALNATQAHRAYSETRQLGLQHDWLAALEKALGLPPTGAPSYALAQAVASFELSQGQRPTGSVQKNLVRLQSHFEVLNTLSPLPSPANSTESAPRRYIAQGMPEDRALQRCKVASSYRDYAQSVLKSTSFVGQAVVGHPDFLARLRNAESWLSARCDGRQGTELGSHLGIHTVSSFRPSTPKHNQLLHGIGCALDINPVANNWNFGHASNGALRHHFHTLMKDVSRLLGQSVVTRAGDLSKLSRQTSTQAGFATLVASNEALKRYRSLGTDLEALKTHLAHPDTPKAAKADSAEVWQQRIQSQERLLATRTGDSQAESPSGFMDFQSLTVQALRDVAGFRWGGTDLGAESGDMMHFDSYNTQPAKRLHQAIKKARAESTDAAPAETTS